MLNDRFSPVSSHETDETPGTVETLFNPENALNDPENPVITSILKRFLA